MIKVWGFMAARGFTMISGGGAGVACSEN